MADPRLIDLHHLGRDRVIGTWQVGDTLIDPGPSTGLDALTAALGEDFVPRRLLLTHIHLDHAGASGTLVERFPELEVWVHERGIRHMADPAALLKSATRLYGEDGMAELWGEFRPVPQDNLHVLSGGEQLDDGFEVAYTPGHASHHVSYRRDDWVFTGDVAGVRIPPSELAIPPTPPPDIDLAAWHASIDLIAEWKPAHLGLTHFGPVDDVLRHLGDLSRRLDAWSEVARDAVGPDEFIARVTDQVERASDLDTAASYTQAAPPDQLYQGLKRYWDKRA